MKFLLFIIIWSSVHLSCRETRSISTGEFSEVKNGQNFEVSEAEVERMMDVITARIERGEDISATMTKIIQLAVAKQGPAHAWQGLRLPAAQLAKLKAKHASYLLLYRKSLDSYGFVPGCDGLLFTSLLVAAGLDHKLGQAESLAEPGKWHRNAAQDCFLTGQSVSTISRDMLLGLSLALWKTDDVSSLQRLLAYSDTHRGRLGEANTALDQGRAMMSPSLLTLLTEMNFKLSGAASDHRGYFPETLGTLQGFEAHLQVLRLLMKTSLYGGLIKTDFEILEKLVLKQPKNALFQAVYHGLLDGDGSSAAAILLNPNYFPEQNLPSTSQRCEPYLWQRDQDTADWEACPGKKEQFPAVDFFWVYALLNQGWKLP